MQAPADIKSEAFWLEHALQTARARNFEFYVQSFLRDYPPLGLWTVRQNILPPYAFTAFHSFPCMGLYDEQGNAKPEVTDIWQSYLP